MDKGGGGKTLIHKMWIKRRVFFLLNPSLKGLPCFIFAPHGLLTALWEGLAREVRDLRQAEGEEWAQEGAMHLYRVIREVGKRMMEKAYMGEPVQQGQGGGLGSEE